MNHPCYGQAFDQTVACFAECEALVVRHQNLLYSMRELMLAELEQGAS
jgi:hypothetical protein